MHVVARGIEHVRKRGAIRRVPPVRHVQRTRGVRRHELHDDRLMLPGVAASIALAELVNAADLARGYILHEEEIDEPRASHFRLGDVRVRRQRGDDGLGKLTRVAACGLGQAHGHVRGEVAVLRIARALDGDSGRVGRFCDERADELLQGGDEKLFQLRFQGLTACDRVGRKGRKSTQKRAQAAYAFA
jgi:hypothetical protein